MNHEESNCRLGICTYGEVNIIINIPVVGIASPRNVSSLSKSQTL